MASRRFRFNLSSGRGGGERWILDALGWNSGQHINTSHKSAINIVYGPQGFISKIG